MQHLHQGPSNIDTLTRLNNGAFTSGPLEQLHTDTWTPWIMAAKSSLTSPNTDSLTFGAPGCGHFRSENNDTMDPSITDFLVAEIRIKWFWFRFSRLGYCSRDRFQLELPPCHLDSIFRLAAPSLCHYELTSIPPGFLQAERTATKMVQGCGGSRQHNREDVAPLHHWWSTLAALCSFRHSAFRVILWWDARCLLHYINGRKLQHSSCVRLQSQSCLWE